MFLFCKGQGGRSIGQGEFSESCTYHQSHLTLDPQGLSFFVVNIVGLAPLLNFTKFHSGSRYQFFCRNRDILIARVVNYSRELIHGYLVRTFCGVAGVS